MKRFKLLLALAALPALAAAAPTVTFEGLVATQTCQLKINGETNPIVVLPTVAVADFNGAGSRIGRTPLSFTASDCQMVTGNVVLYASFLAITSRQRATWAAVPSTVPATWRPN